MPYARTWSEELVAEWLEIEGYSVVIGLPVGTGRGGGRKEADVVGFRFEDRIAHVVHIEVGNFAASSKKIIEVLRKKFERNVEEEIEKYIRERLGENVNISHKKMVVATWISKKAEEEAKRELREIELLNFNDLLKKIILTVKKYVKDVKTFPDGFWLLNLLWYMNYHKILLMEEG